MKDSIFHIFDISKGNSINLQEFCYTFTDLIYGRINERLRFLAKVFDINKKNAISADDMRRILYTNLYIEKENVNYEPTETEKKDIERILETLYEYTTTSVNGELCLGYMEFQKIIMRRFKVYEFLTIFQIFNNPKEIGRAHV